MGMASCRDSSVSAVSRHAIALGIVWHMTHVVQVSLHLLSCNFIPRSFHLLSVLLVLSYMFMVYVISANLYVSSYLVTHTSEH
ncbi:hypothetical protein K503DRAFT_527116 [Rhizopogon vinicolor AM-OR11-026]|uniref:Uncharacterized protein n=1 Tax=Rhizopogon vinicolor AM-OR11-026 TaxID=1314800 RepID=A0A1B7N8M3_9AGAM|nr:hypothetical protein K503DRAFT_527116 [Rhizopogon vinicolor AM-OR11-026]